MCDKDGLEGVQNSGVYDLRCQTNTTVPERKFEAFRKSANNSEGLYTSGCMQVRDMCSMQELVFAVVLCRHDF